MEEFPVTEGASRESGAAPSPEKIASNSQMPVRVRFAFTPAPSLSLVQARIALLNYLFAKKKQGRLILRVDDTDPEKATPEALDRILNDLKWFQIEWQEGPHAEGPHGPYRQSLRSDFYQKHVERLLSEGKAYPCYCNPEKLDEERRRFLAQGKPPRYTGACRDLTGEQRSQFEQQGIKPAVRLRLERQVVKFHDAVHGDFSIDSDTVGDLVVQLASGRPTYHLVCVVDDILMKISHVIRGQDDLSNTFIQILLFNAFGVPPPAYAHIPLILGADKTLLSVKHGLSTVEDLRKEGYFPQAAANYLAMLGWSSPDRREEMTLEEIAERFELSRLSRSSHSFEIEKLNWFNGRYLREIGPGELLELARGVPGYEEALGLKGKDWIESTLLILQRQCRTLKEIGENLKLLVNPVGDLPEDAKKALSLKDAPKLLKLLSEEIHQVENLDQEITTRVLESVKGKIKSKSKNIYAPVRVALTGKLDGPELPVVASLLGKEECLRRIDYVLKNLQHPAPK